MIKIINLSLAAAAILSLISSVSAIHINGNRFIDDKTGKVVVLQGFSHSGSEFACVSGYGFFDGPTDDASIETMKGWNANAVRVPLNEDCWLGINGIQQQYSGSYYRAAIGGYVRRIISHGMYVIIDLHWTHDGS
jgi:hypothetical protein